MSGSSIGGVVQASIGKSVSGSASAALKKNAQGTAETALRGLPGPKGDPFTYQDFTPEQLEALKGKDGDVINDITIEVENVLGYLQFETRVTYTSGGVTQVKITNGMIPLPKDGVAGGHYVPTLTEDGLLTWEYYPASGVVERIPILDLKGPKGDGVPEVSAEDEGKYLRVVNGVWTPQENQTYQIGDGLKLDEATNTLSVDTADAVEQDNTLPITSAAVYAEVGNINALLATI